LKSEFTELFQEVKKRKPGRFRRPLLTLLICLGISIFLWILVRFSKDYVYTVQYRLYYTEIPEYLRFETVPDSILTLNIKVQGFDFFSEEYFRTRDRSFDVSLKGLKIRGSMENHYTGFLLSQNIAMDISRETNYPLEIYSTSPDTLFFRFERKPLRKSLNPKISSSDFHKMENPGDSAVIHRDTATRTRPVHSTGTDREPLKLHHTRR